VGFLKEDFHACLFEGGVSVAARGDESFKISVGGLEGAVGGEDTK
jgi:hypothetical protein